MDGWELDNYSIIDRKSMGGNRKNIQLSDYGNLILEPYLKRICEEKQIKVINFFSDYFYFLEQLCRITKKNVILTLGNRTVDSTLIDLTSISKKYLNNCNFKVIKKIERNITSKRTPKILKVNKNKTIQSMNKEYVLIAKKLD